MNAVSFCGGGGGGGIYMFYNVAILSLLQFYICISVIFKMKNKMRFAHTRDVSALFHSLIKI